MSPEFNQTAVAVQPDGFVTLRGVGDLKVAGQTVPELTETLRTAYSKILNDPAISVVLKDFEKPYFVAGGQVAKPGKYDMHGQITLIQAIEIAGGFQSSAKHSQVYAVSPRGRPMDRGEADRREEDGEERKPCEKIRSFTPETWCSSRRTRMSKIDRFIPNLSMGTYLPLQIP